MSACSESIPQGATRPVVKDELAATGTSGFAITLRVDVEHGRGEAVLPQGLALSTGTATAAWADLRAAGFALPDQDAGAPARLSAAAADPAHPDRAHTILELPLVLLPAKPGRNKLELPPLPIAVARASGEIMTVCTAPHTVTVEDPIANVAEAVPQPNPPPLAQREDWKALRIATIALAAALVLGALVWWLASRWARRPKPAIPPPPPKPAWDVALARLAEIRRSGLLERGELREYVDAVTDVVREYLGARYDFDGIESTTDEVRRALLPLSLGAVSLPTIIEMLEASDLVKFAGIVPPPDDCLRMMATAEQIVRATMLAPSRTAFGPPPAPPEGAAA